MRLRYWASVAKQAAKRALYRVLPDRALNALVRRLPPRWAQLESTIACNLSCPLCVTHVMPRNHRYLRPEHVDSVLAGCGGRLKNVSFHLQGEPLLNPELAGMIRKCHDRGVWTIFSTNGMLLDRHVEELLDSGLDKISIAIDGVDAADYERYRQGGDFDTVVANIRKLLAARDARGQATPVVQLQTIMFSYNEDREDEVRAFLEEFGADEIELKRPSYFFDLSLAEQFGGLEKETAAYTERAHAFLEQVDHEDTGRKYARSSPPEELNKHQRLCPLLEGAAVLADGRVVSCGMDAMGVSAYGDLNEQSFEEIWRGPGHAKLLEDFLRGELAPCHSCTLWTTR